MSLFEIFITISFSLIFVLGLMIFIAVLRNGKKDEPNRLEMNELINNYTKQITNELQLFQEKISKNGFDLNNSLRDYSLNIAKTSLDNYHELEVKLINSSESLKVTLKDALQHFSNENHSTYQKLEDRLICNINDRLNQIDAKVNSKLDEGFKKTNETFEHIVERISRIDEAQKKIEELSTNIVSLEDILTDKKSRGTFGEVGLRQILASVFGENNIRIYEMQKSLSNGNIPDCVLHCPSPLGLLCIDSKFPLENYRRLVSSNQTDGEREVAFKAFNNDLKKHINDIHDKYIIASETSDQAVLFLPSEAIFAEINAYHTEIVDYAYRKKVWITSPTTLMAFLTTIQVMLKNLERDKYTKIIQEELEKLSLEFGRYRNRWDKLKKDIDSVSRDVNDIHITTGKISDKFEKISAVELDNELIAEKVTIEK